MRHILYVSLFIMSISASAQMRSVENYNLGSGGIASGGAIRFNNYSALSSKVGELVDYSEIKGKCFWNDDWSPAILVMKIGGAVKLKKVKVNLYSNDIHYKNDAGAEFVTQLGIVKVLMLSPGDTTKIAAIFQSLTGLYGTSEQSFGQVLNDGKTQLIKKVTVKLDKRTDPVTSKSEYQFNSFTNYYILENGNATLMRSINKTSLLSILKATNAADEWLKANKNKLKSEADAIAFLDYYNGTSSK